MAGLLNAFMLVPPAVGIPGMFRAALAGLVAARAVGPRAGGRWPAFAGTLAAVCGLAGWLSSPEVRMILAADGLRGLGAALAANPGGWLAWVAFVRGMPYARLPPDPDRVGSLITMAVPGLALAAVVGGRFPEHWSSAYLAAAEDLQVLVFLLAAIPALALGRMAQVDRGAPMGWWRNPSWVTLAALLLLGTASIAVFVSATAGPAIAMAASAMVVPLLLVALVAGIDRRLLRVILVCAAVAGVVALALRLIGNVSRPAPPAPAGSGSQARDAASAVPVTLSACCCWLWPSRPSSRCCCCGCWSGERNGRGPRWTRTARSTTGERWRLPVVSVVEDASAAGHRPPTPPRHTGHSSRTSTADRPPNACRSRHLRNTRAGCATRARAGCHWTCSRPTTGSSGSAVRGSRRGRPGGPWHAGPRCAGRSCRRCRRRDAGAGRPGRPVRESPACPTRTLPRRRPDRRLRRRLVWRLRPHEALARCVGDALRLGGPRCRSRGSSMAGRGWLPGDPDRGDPQRHRARGTVGRGVRCGGGRLTPAEVG